MDSCKREYSGENAAHEPPHAPSVASGWLDGYARVRGEAGYQPTGQRARGGGTAVLDYRA